MYVISMSLDRGDAPIDGRSIVAPSNQRVHILTGYMVLLPSEI